MESEMISRKEDTFFDVIDIMENLKMQLEEVEMLESMFPYRNEFKLFNANQIYDVRQFIDGKSNEIPSNFDFKINLTVDDKILIVNVTLPSSYPKENPEIFIRNDLLPRSEQKCLNENLAEHIMTLKKGEVKIWEAISWLQQNATSYFMSKTTKICKITKPEEQPIVFSRIWIYSHHIYSKHKINTIMDLAQEHDATGFCLPGKPGIICIEGAELECNEMWRKIRALSWKKITCRKREDIPVPLGNSYDALRRFSLFQEVNLDSKKTNHKGSHRDMAQFCTYLATHNCEYVFHDLFGLDTKEK